MKIGSSYKIKIRELFKYLFLPLSLGLVVLSVYFSDTVINEDNFYLSMIFVGIPSLIFLTAVIFTLFIFFREKPEITVLYFIVLLLLQSIIPIKDLRNDYDLAGFLLSLLATAYIVLAARSQKRIKDNRYLFFLLISCGVVFSINFFMFALTFWTVVETGILLLISIGLFLIISLALIFSLPSSDFLEWKKEQKRFFIKAIIVPWVYILYISLMSLLINPYENIAARKTDTSPPWGMKNYVIEVKDGME
jgi:hypothetical protein